MERLNKTMRLGDLLFRERKGSIIAMIKGTDVQRVSDVLLKLSRRRRFQVREITLNLASSMHQIACICFPGAKQVRRSFSCTETSL